MATDSSSAAQLSDANIVALLDEANKADSAAGAVALKKASSPEVKRFAPEMMGEHHALRLEGEQEGDGRARLDGRRAGIDRAYIEQEVAAHRAVKDLLDQAAGACRQCGLKAAIAKATSIIARHLSEAEKLQQKLAAEA